MDGVSLIAVTSTEMVAVAAPVLVALVVDLNSDNFRASIVVVISGGGVDEIVQRGV